MIDALMEIDIQQYISENVIMRKTNFKGTKNLLQFYLIASASLIYDRNKLPLKISLDRF